MQQKWLSSGLHAAHCPDLIDKDSWPPNSMDMNLLDYHVWGSILLSPESAAEGHPGTEVSACEDLGRVTTRRYLQVDREFQEAYASLCKHRWRTFSAVTVTLLIPLTCLLFFATLKATRCSKIWSLTNCSLILWPCSVEIFALNVQSFIISEVLK